MPIKLEDLRSKSVVAKSAGVTRMSEHYSANAAGVTTAFLCHSHNDQDLVLGLQRVLAEHGWKLYIDWQDGTMPARPNRVTAQKIQKKIRDLTLFLFLATPNSTASRWCPWEIGYADGVKPTDNILIIPTADRSGNHYGNEYLQLYRYIDFTTNYDLRAFNPKTT